MFSFQKLCEKLYDLPQERIKELKIKTDETGKPMVNCFMHDIQRYFEVGLLSKSSSGADIAPSMGVVRGWRYANGPLWGKTIEIDGEIPLHRKKIMKLTVKIQDF
jgi:hypothetical protein